MVAERDVNMAEPLNDAQQDDLSKAADLFEGMARSIQAKQRGQAGRPASKLAPAAPEQVWMSRFGYRAISDAAEGGTQQMKLEAHAPVSFRPEPMLDVSRLKPVLPQMREPVTAITAQPVAQQPIATQPVLPAAEQGFARRGDLRLQAGPNEPKPKRGFFSRMFGRA